VPKDSITVLEITLVCDGSCRNSGSASRKPQKISDPEMEKRWKLAVGTRRPSYARKADELPN
jgi:hypothetical protein